MYRVSQSVSLIVSGGNCSGKEVGCPCSSEQVHRHRPCGVRMQIAGSRAIGHGGCRQFSAGLSSTDLGEYEFSAACLSTCGDWSFRPLCFRARHPCCRGRPSCFRRSVSQCEPCL